MSEVYSIWKGPTYQPLSPNDMMADALNQPMSFLDTLSDQFVGGVISSPVLGTAIRENTLPEQLPEQGFWNRNGPLFGLGETEPQEKSRYLKPMTEEEYKNSPYYRKGLPYDPRFTEDRAAALAMSYDARKVREYFASKRPFTAFVGGLAGQATDPINYLPVAGPLVKGAAVARLGRLGGEIAAASLDAASNTALAEVGTYQTRRSLGDDITWQSTVTDIAMAGLIGAAFGGLHGVTSLYREGKTAAALAERQKAITDQLSTLENTQTARIALNDAIDSLVHGEEVNLSPNSIEPIARIADELNPAFRPYTLGKADRTELFSGTALNRVIDTRPVLVQDFEGAIRKQVFDAAPEIAAKYQAAQEKFNAAQAKVNDLEAPLADRRQSDTVRLVDKASADRLQAVETELEKTIPAARRASLEAERSAIVESISPDVLAKAEKDFRIGPEKRIKEARKSLASARQQFAKVSNQVDTASKTLMQARRPVFQTRVDTSVAKQDAPPSGIKEAAARIAKPEDAKALAEQFGVDPENGTFLEHADIDQVRQEGRLTESDEADLEAADKAFEIGSAFGEALKAAVACII